MMRRLQGAYSVVALTPREIIAFRDPLGVRPLCVGVFRGGWVIASESCALDHIGATLLRELDPGEAVQIDGDGLRSIHAGNEGAHALCSFEYIYFARPDSILDGRLVHAARREMGRQLAIEHPVDADMVMGIPDSAIAAGTGYAEEADLPYQEGLVKNRYVGRTFIQPDQRLRDLGVRLKFNPLPEVLQGKRVVVVDDSIVRGTTTPHVVHLLRSAGAKEVHLRVCAPPIISPCHFGVDMATKSELVAAQKSMPEICEFIGADSLGYLSVAGLFKAIGRPRKHSCAACFTGEYPMEVQLEMGQAGAGASLTARLALIPGSLAPASPSAPRRHWHWQLTPTGRPASTATPRAAPRTASSPWPARRSRRACWATSARSARCTG